jgi:outer membrane biosynthesis protein TonB
LSAISSGACSYSVEQDAMTRRGQSVAGDEVPPEAEEGPPEAKPKRTPKKESVKPKAPVKPKAAPKGRKEKEAEKPALTDSLRCRYGIAACAF